MSEEQNPYAELFPGTRHEQLRWEQYRAQWELNREMNHRVVQSLRVSVAVEVGWWRKRGKSGMDYLPVGATGTICKDQLSWFVEWDRYPHPKARAGYTCAMLQREGDILPGWLTPTHPTPAMAERDRQMRREG